LFTSATTRLRPAIQASAHRAYRSAPVNVGAHSRATASRSTVGASLNLRVSARSTLALEATSSATPTYSSLSSLPGRINALSSRSGLRCEELCLSAYDICITCWPAAGAACKAFASIPCQDSRMPCSLAHSLIRLQTQHDPMLQSDAHSDATTSIELPW